VGISTTELAQQVQSATSDLQQSVTVSGVQEAIDRVADAFVGNVFTDRHGYRVQVSRYVIRPDDKTVDKVSVSNTTDGPMPGQSTLETYVTYNQALPYDWTQVTKVGLNATAIDPVTGLPSYYLVKAGMLATNPVGDDVCQCKSYDPVDGGTLPVLTGGVWGQGYREEYRVNHQMLGYEVVGTTGLHVTGNNIQVVMGSTSDGLGGWQADFYNLDAAVLMFSERVYLTSADGGLLNMTDYVANPNRLKDFSLIPKAVGINVSFNSNYFSSPSDSIDLLLLPDFMDADF
jgi:hypothetical protein